MSNPVVIITDKVIRMIRSMVYLAMRLERQGGATSEDISRFLHSRGAGIQGSFHLGVVERALWELHSEGLVDNAGARWYLADARG